MQISSLRQFYPKISKIAQNHGMPKDNHSRHGESQKLLVSAKVFTSSPLKMARWLRIVMEGYRFVSLKVVSAKFAELTIF